MWLLDHSIWGKALHDRLHRRKLLRPLLLAVAAVGVLLRPAAATKPGTAWSSRRSMRRAKRARHSRGRRQRDRCRGRGRLCAGGGRSVLRQYRRRRVHADPPRRWTATFSSISARRRRRAATPDMYPRHRRASRSARRASTAIAPPAVPGTVMGSTGARPNTAGSPRDAVMAPAIALAREGLCSASPTRRSSPRRPTRLGRRSATPRGFSCAPDGTPYKAGDRLVQPDLAATLGAIAKEGPDAFYRGADRRPRSRPRWPRMAAS